MLISQLNLTAKTGTLEKAKRGADLKIAIPISSVAPISLTHFSLIIKMFQYF